MRENRVRSLIGTVPAGAALLMAGTSLLFTFTGAEGVWISSPGPLPALWHVLMAAVLTAGVFPSAFRGRPAFIAAGPLLMVAMRDVMQYYVRLTDGAIRTTTAFPLSALVVAVLIWCLARLRPTPDRETRRAPFLPRLAGVAAGGLLMTLALLLTFGATDYRRRADCAIVLGAGVWNDGSPSLALSDRVKEGIRLWQSGLVSHLIMTGGTGQNGWSEPEVMKRMAIEAGVPAEAVLTDPDGVDTFRSADNCGVIMAREGFSSALVVSHYYHLARCRMVFTLAGIKCATVPAHMTRRLVKEPHYVLRECAGFLAYLLPR